jgi:glucosamine--fructose-6-phosphate aminotransferase (isomerizing)
MNRLQAAGSPVLLISSRDESDPAGRIRIRVPSARHALLQPLAAVQAAYPMLAALARERGRDPDTPAQLHKITRTL